MSATIPIDSTNSPPTILIVDDDNDDKSIPNESIHSTEATTQNENNEMKSTSVNNIEMPTTDNNSTRPSQQSLQLLDELKYLLRPTNSLASPLDNVQASVSLSFDVFIRCHFSSIIIVFVCSNSKKPIRPFNDELFILTMMKQMKFNVH